MNVEPVTLSGSFVRLEPLSLAHVPALFEVARDPAMWQFTTTRMARVEDMRAYVEEALDARSRGEALPFATVAADTGAVLGSSRFANIVKPHRRAEIGWTWLTPSAQRTPANTEAKLLMLQHAFETWGCVRVEFKTDSRNARSRAALLRIGALEEGTLRQHMVMPDGVLRHSVYYSILDSEWPAVKARLVERLAR